ncbi:hypothetical protein PHYSODRAFT_261624 [Phytophthora sojae]|uniref:Uncharacterized protein n=1 Tax=Phytophthora sojae (strain P6497) TaxID=1094619 RepID=G4YF00_PHYSP|nr:hypothetical protein PHYSODRAFT_261624 [Phytophthora sojae]EGZ27583.1 hypothetical protein PHYSODRAFT_261624 [Phytophthora sojae]|eukprot:XP_009514858.1 hypothetical protein PHYSODRAFT_261624 [Phytophthora sojae]
MSWAHAREKLDSLQEERTDAESLEHRIALPTTDLNAAHTLPDVHSFWLGKTGSSNDAFALKTRTDQPVNGSYFFLTATDVLEAERRSRFRGRQHRAGAPAGGDERHDLLPIIQKHVMFVLGSSLSGNMTSLLRLSFSWYDFLNMQPGALRLSDAIRGYQEVFAAQYKPAAATSAASDRNNLDVVMDVTLHAEKAILYLREQKDAGKISKLSALMSSPLVLTTLACGPPV